jgi:hypothetical protein
MLSGPRDHAELETVLSVVTSSHAWASGQVAEPGSYLESAFHARSTPFRSSVIGGT